MDPVHNNNPIDDKSLSSSQNAQKPEAAPGFKASQGSGANEGFAQKDWGFNAEEAKKFISTLANFIITQIKHEDQKVKETAEKLKQAEQGEDS
jgi:hypothetical protein